MPRILFALMLCAISLFVKAQSRLDSLYNHGRNLVMMNTDSSDRAAAEVLSEVVRLAIEESNRKLEAQGYHLLCYCYTNTDTDTAIQLLTKATDLYYEIEHEEYLGAINYLGYLYARRSDFKMALEIYQKSLDYAEKIGSDEDIAYALSEFGYVYDRMENYTKAIEYNRQALKHNPIGETNALILGRIGIAYDELAEYDSAIYYNRLAIEEFKRYDILYGQILWLSNLGNTFSKQNRWNEAIVVLEEAEELGSDSQILEANVYINLGKAYLETGNMTQSLEKIQKGIQLAKDRSIIRSEYEGEYRLFEWYQKNGDLNASLYHLERYIEMKDSAQNSERIKYTEEFQERYESERKDRLIAEREREIARKELALQNENYKFLISAALLVLVIIIAYFVYSSQKQKRLQLRKQYELKSEIQKTRNREKISEEKLRISKELHDNIGAQITFMINSVDNLAFVEQDDEKKKRLSNLGGFGREAMKDLRNTIWAMKSEKSDTSTLMVKLAELKSRTTPPPEIELVNTLEHPLELKAVEMLNLLRIIQEGIQNAIKYAEAGKVTVRLTGSEKDLSLEIKDDGRGFDLGKAGSGNGLMHMKERAERVGAQFAIHSLPGKGTSITVSLLPSANPVG